MQDKGVLAQEIYQFCQPFLKYLIKFDTKPKSYTGFRV